VSDALSTAERESRVRELISLATYYPDVLPLVTTTVYDLTNTTTAYVAQRACLKMVCLVCGSQEQPEPLVLMDHASHPHWLDVCVHCSVVARHVFSQLGLT
jgi:hypothetical protein